MLLQALPEGSRRLVVTLTIVQPASQPQAGLGMVIGRKILRQALIQLDGPGQVLPLFLETGQRPEGFGSPGQNWGLGQPRLIRLQAVGELVLPLIDGPQQIVGFGQMWPLWVPPHHLLKRSASLVQAPTTELHRTAFQEHAAYEHFGLCKGGESSQAGIDFLPELSLRQAIKAGQELLWVWLGTLRLGKLPQQ